MEPLNEAHCHRILEVPMEATFEEITRSYHWLKGVYGSEEGAFNAPSLDEFSPSTRKKVLAEVEAAYQELSRLHGETLSVHPTVPEPKEPDLSYSSEGTILRRIRQAAGISLEHLAAETNIRMDYLHALEDESFEALPLAPVYVRGYLSAYLATLGVTSDQVIPAYMHRHQLWQGRKGK